MPLNFIQIEQANVRVGHQALQVTEFPTNALFDDAGKNNWFENSLLMSPTNPVYDQKGVCSTKETDVSFDRNKNYKWPLLVQNPRIIPQKMSKAAKLQ